MDEIHGSSAVYKNESIIHNHYKHYLFCPGMLIKSKNNYAIIEKVFNEVEIGTYFQKRWDRKIYVDILLLTDKGYIIVEIHYTNKKKIDEYIDYYNQLDLLDVLEVDVMDLVNASENLTFRSLLDEYKRYEAIKKYKPYWTWYKFFVGRFSICYKIDSDHYGLKCYSNFSNYNRVYSASFKECILVFKIDDKYTKRKRLTDVFPQPWISWFSAEVSFREMDGYYEVRRFYNPAPFQTQSFDWKLDFYDRQKLVAMLMSGYKEHIIKNYIN